MIPNNTLLYLQTTAWSNGHQRAENVHQVTEGQCRDRDRDTQLNIRHSSELGDAVGEGDERLQKSEESMKHEKTKNQLTWTPRHSQRLKQQSGSFQESDLGPLHQCYCCIGWCSYRPPNSGSGKCI